MKPSEGFCWYLIQTRPRQEARAEEHLVRQHFECYRPLTTLAPTLGRSRKSVEEALFPGYLFIHMDQVNSRWYPIRSTRGVDRIVSFGGHPCPVQDSLIEQIRQRLAAPSTQLAPPQFSAGEAVRINSGELYNLQAIFLSSNGEQRAVILLNLLHREQRITLPMSHLSRMDV